MPLYGAGQRRALAKPNGQGKGTRSYSYPIIVGGKKRGKVEAYYKERAGFLPEEKKFDERSEPDDFQNH